MACNCDAYIFDICEQHVVLECVCEMCAKFGQQYPHIATQKEFGQPGLHTAPQVPGMVPQSEDEDESERPLFIAVRSLVPFEATGDEALCDSDRSSMRDAARQSPARMPSSGFSIVPAEPEFAALGSKRSTPFHKRVKQLMLGGKPQEAPKLRVPDQSAEVLAGGPDQKTYMPAALKRLLEKVPAKGGSTRVVPFEMPKQETDSEQDVIGFAA